MALNIQWTPQAIKGFDKTLHYLDEEWTKKEILQLEKKITQVTNQISHFPDLFPRSEKNSQLYKAIIDKNNYLVYRINLKKSTVEIINYRGTKQKTKY